MSCVPNITFDTFPKQSEMKGFRIGDPVKVCFHYDADRTIKGKIIRNDVEEPHMMIISLEDGRVVLATECQYSPEV